MPCGNRDQWRNEFSKLLIPLGSPYDARAAVLGPDGGDSYIVAQDRRFLLDNRVDLAERAAETLAKEVSSVGHDLQKVCKDLKWAPVSVAAQGHTPVSWVNATLAIVLSIVCVIGMAVSNVVLSAYVLESAAPLFANNPIGASLFATLPSFGAVALKIFEGKLTSATVRWFYGASLFAVGVASLATWMIATAITFAPDGGIASDLLNAEGGSNRTGAVLLLATVICEVAFGATILSGIAHLLTGKSVGGRVPNPEYVALVREKSRIERLLANVRRNHFEVQDYLMRAAAGREQTRLAAEHELDRARELWTQAQTAAQAFAIAMFLKTPKEFE